MHVPFWTHSGPAGFCPIAGHPPLGMCCGLWGHPRTSPSGGLCPPLTGFLCALASCKPKQVSYWKSAECDGKSTELGIGVLGFKHSILYNSLGHPTASPVWACFPQQRVVCLHSHTGCRSTLVAHSSSGRVGAPAESQSVCSAKRKRKYNWGAKAKRRNTTGLVR